MAKVWLPLALLPAFALSPLFGNSRIRLEVRRYRSSPVKSILAKLLRCSRVEMDGERIQDQMVDIHIHHTLIPEPVLVARGKSLYPGLCPSLEISSGLSQRNELGTCAHTHVCTCACTLMCAYTSPADLKCITSKRGMAKNSRRQPQSKCVFPKLVPTNLRDPSIFFYGLYPGGLTSVCQVTSVMPDSLWLYGL